MGRSHFAFRPLNEKQKNRYLSVLCASAVNYYLGLFAKPSTKEIPQKIKILEVKKKIIIRDLDKGVVCHYSIVKYYRII